MTGWLQAFDQLLSFVTLLTRICVVALGGCLVVIVCTEVVCRYVLNYSLFFSDELARYLFIWVSFLGASLALRNGMHIGLELNFHSTSRLIKTSAHFFTAVFLIIFLVTSCGLLPAMWDQFATTLEIRMFWIYLAMPVGALLMLIQLIPIVWRKFPSMAPPPEVLGSHL